VSEWVSVGEQVSRRRFLAQLAGGLGLTAGVTTGLPGCATVTVYPGSLSGGRIVLQRPELDEAMAAKRVVRLSAPGFDGTILLVKAESGEYRALDATCTHQGCQVRPTGSGLTCPCHGSSYNLDGEVVRGPAQKPLHYYNTEVKAETIEIWL